MNDLSIIEERSVLDPAVIESILNEVFALGRGDCLKFLKTLESDSIDAMVTDPPGGIGFMGNDWDKAKKGSKKWIRDLSTRLKEAYRVLKPGAIAIVWSMPKTSHWTGQAIEQAGFEIFDTLHHTFGSGMAHSADSSKAVDWHYFMTWCKAEKWPYEVIQTCRRAWKRKCNATKRNKLMKALYARLQVKAGLVRPVIGTYKASGNAGTPIAEKGGSYVVGAANSEAVELTRTTGATDDAKQWDGYGTGLRPSHEVWWICQKPFKTGVAKNLLKHGVGALNIDDCRVPRGYTERGEAWKKSGHSRNPEAPKIAAPPSKGMSLHPKGGWPGNVACTHDERCTPSGCHSECPCAIMDEQSGHTVVRQATSRKEYTGQGTTYSEDRPLHVSPSSTYSDEGGASRYFNRFWWTARDAVSTLYYAKASTAEREAGCERLPKRKGFELVKREEGSAGMGPHSGAGRTSKGRANFHPTVKCEALMAHLCRLACPKGGTVLDPYLGSGTTAAAAIKQGFHVVGCELTAAYIPIIESRARHAVRELQRSQRQLSLFDEEPPPAPPPPPEPKQLSLLGAAE